AQRTVQPQGRMRPAGGCNAKLDCRGSRLRSMCGEEETSNDTDELDRGPSFGIRHGRQPRSSMTGALFVAQPIYRATRLVKGSLKSTLRRLARLQGSLESRKAESGKGLPQKRREICLLRIVAKALGNDMGGRRFQE